MLDKCLPRNQSGHIKHIKQSNKLSRGGEEDVVRLSRREEVSETFPAFSDKIAAWRKSDTILFRKSQFRAFLKTFFPTVFNIFLSRGEVLVWIRFSLLVC